FELLNDYKRAATKNYYFVSDWNVTDNHIEYPFGLIEKAFDASKEQTIRYLFPEDQRELKSLILQSLTNTLFKPSEIDIVGSATAALYATLLSLHKSGISNYLVFTPVYFSILDTLVDFGVEIYFFHLKDTNGFRIDFKALEEAINTFKIETLIITDPYYSCGISLQDADLTAIARLSAEKNFYLIIDSSLGGLEWTRTNQNLLPIGKLNAISASGKCILIDSLSKKLLLNGIKSAVIFGNNSLIKTIEQTINQFYGGFSSSQLLMLKELYLSDNSADVKELLDGHKLKIVDNFELLNSVLRESDYYAYPSNSGFFTIVAHKYFTMKELDVKRIIRKFLFDEQVLALPSFYFCLHPENKFGFRINLLLNPKDLMPAILKCIRIDLKPFKQNR
ncbi:MAG: pyridoxal phosphate-dependent aminotransferase, partial [Bacteroidetes bacterium]|nr:pyridoxal phosphate-dependent aminotransferase [Bacteroidota bacterium]